MEQVVHTYRRSCRRSWPRGYGELIPNSRSWMFTSVSVSSVIHHFIFVFFIYLFFPSLFLSWGLVYFFNFKIWYWRFYWARSTKDPADPHWFVVVLSLWFSFPYGFQSSFLPVYTSPKCGTEPIRYETLHFRDRCRTASLRYRNRAKITVLVCEQKPYPVWFPCWRKSILWT